MKQINNFFLVYYIHKCISGLQVERVIFERITLETTNNFSPQVIHISWRNFEQTELCYVPITYLLFNNESLQ